MSTQGTEGRGVTFLEAMLIAAVMGIGVFLLVNMLLPRTPSSPANQGEVINLLDLPECPSEDPAAITWDIGDSDTGNACVWDSGINERDWGGVTGKRWGVYSTDCSFWQHANVVQDASNWACVQYRRT